MPNKASGQMKSPPFREWSAEDAAALRDGRMSEVDYQERIRVRRRFGMTGNDLILTGEHFREFHGMFDLIEVLTPLPGDDTVLEIIQAFKWEMGSLLALMAEELRGYRYRPTIPELRAMLWAAKQMRRELQNDLGMTFGYEEDRDLRVIRHLLGMPESDTPGPPKKRKPRVRL